MFFSSLSTKLGDVAMASSYGVTGKQTIEFTLRNDLRPWVDKPSAGGTYRRHLGRSNLFTVGAVNPDVLDFSEQGLAPRLFCSGLVNRH